MRKTTSFSSNNCHCVVEHVGPKLASCPGRHPTSLRPCSNALLHFERPFEKFEGLLRSLKINLLVLLHLRCFNAGVGNRIAGQMRPCEQLIWPASDFWLPKLEYNITSKRSSVISRYLVNKEKTFFLIVR